MTAQSDDAAAVIQQVIGCKTLPSLPSVALQILELTRDETATSADIAACVELDQALAAKILKTINSSFYGLSSPCPTIARAINYLGMNTVRSLVLGFSLVDSFGDPDGAEGFDLIAHWRRAMYGAVAARLSSKHFPACDGDEAFIGAMLRDVGSLAASIALGDDYNKLCAQAGSTHRELAQTEYSQLAVNHARLGAELAKTWKIPAELVDAIAHHHDVPSKVPDAPLTRCVYFASLAADALSENPTESTDAKGRVETLATTWLKLDQLALRAFFDELKTGASELARLFNIDTGAAPDIDALMSEAEDQKLQLQIAQEREAQELRESNTELARQRFTDGLTGALNRAAFDEALAELYQNAQAQGTSLTIAFSDADKFKSFNDTHGHQAGDEVLIELAKRMQETAGDQARVFRYGGEEFAILAPNLSVDESVHLAERIRETVGSEPFNMNGLEGVPEELAVTVSIGVAVYDDDTRSRFNDAEAILKAADDAVYQSKENGRNRTTLYDTGDPALLQNDQAAPPAAAPTQPANPDGKLHVLIVDDDPLLLKMLESAIQKSGAADARSVHTVAEAVKLLHFAQGEDRFIPHLVITDLNLPQHSGVKLVRYLRATPKLATTPVVVLSGSNQDQDIRECLAAGANAYLPKSALSEDPFGSVAKVLDFWAIAVNAAA